MRNTCFTGKLAILLALLFIALPVSADKNWRTSGNSKATKAEACVAPVAEMRRNHMDMIEHQRDLTVHQGIRKTDNSLHGCIDCHANLDEQGNHIPVNTQGQFCAGCHGYVAAQLDCFSCHATVPK
jgi:hypothetical protein